MRLHMAAAKALRRAVHSHSGEKASPHVCQEIKRAVITDLAQQGYPLWHIAHRIRVEFIDGLRPNLVMPEELTKPH